MKRLCAAILVLIWSANAVSASGQSPFTVSQLDDLVFRQHLGSPLPLDARLRDEDGRTVALGTFFGKRPVVVVLDYLHCKTLCGFVLSDLVHSLDRVPLTPGRDFEVLAISIDPHDGPAESRAARAQYLARAKHPGGWHFLTGEDADVRRIAGAVGFPYLYDAGAEQYAHPAGVTIAAPNGDIARYILGVDYAPIDLRLALTEASHGAISSAATDLLLLCYCYDSATGRYSAQINTAMRILAGATALGIAAMVVRLSGGGLRRG